MSFRHLTIISRAAVIAACALFPTHGWAQSYPEKPITIVVPFSAGGGVSAFGQDMIKDMQPILGQEMVLEYHPGSGGLIGATEVAKADPDGYTLLLSTAGPITVSPLVYDEVAFDPVEDFDHIVRMGSVPYVLVAHKDMGVSTLEEFLEKVKSGPGEVSYGSAGTGAINFLAMELLQEKSDVELLHIPYQGTSPMTVDLVAGRLNAAMLIPKSIEQYVDDGTLIPLAVTGPKRSELYPDVPTLTEAGVDVNVTSWYGLSAPAGTDPAIIEKLNEAGQAIITNDSFPKRIEARGLSIDGSASPADFEQSIEDQLATWKGVLERVGAAGTK